MPGETLGRVVVFLGICGLHNCGGGGSRKDSRACLYSVIELIPNHLTCPAFGIMQSKLVLLGCKLM